MIDFCLNILVCVSWIWGFEYTLKEGEIFGKPGEWMRRKLPDWVLKPTIDCKYCMSSIHGTVWFLILMPWHLGWWVAFCFCTCGTTAIIDNK